MSRVQVALNVADLHHSVRFYPKLFCGEPSKGWGGEPWEIYTALGEAAANAHQLRAAAPGEPARCAGAPEPSIRGVPLAEPSR